MIVFLSSKKDVYSLGNAGRATKSQLTTTDKISDWQGPVPL